MEAMRIKRGNPYQASITLTGLDGQPLNLTEVTVLFTVRSLTDKALTDDAALIKQAITDHYEPGNGQTYLDLSSEQTTLPPGTYIGDVRVVGSELKANTDPFLVEIEPIVTTRIIEESVLWGLYWDTLISATVEDAAPTDVILTFPEGKPELIDTDITATVNGIARAVSSASWTGAAWTVVLASAVECGDVVVMTFVKTGGTTAVTNNVAEQWSSYWETRKPSALIVTGMRDTEIDFSWTDNSAGDCSFSIYRSTDGVNYSSIGTTVAGDTTYTATGLTAGVLYYFYVVGVKDTNESPTTNIYDTRFKITIDTTKAGSANNTFILPTDGASVYDYYVDWGDGGAEDHVIANTSQTKVYAASGVYQIKIRGIFPRIFFANTGDIAKLMFIDNWGSIKWGSMASAFYGCAVMNGRWIDVPNLSSVTTAIAMFRTCSALNYSLNSFDTSNINVFTRFMRQCSAFKQPILLDISSATALTEMLLECDINIAGTTENYDATLVAWAAADVPNSLIFDGGTSKYGEGLVDNGTTDGVAANKLIQSGQNFLTTVTIGDVVRNVTDGTYAFVTGVDSDTQLSISADIMASGEVYRIQHGAGAKARASLILNDLWTITDGGAL